MRINIFTSLLFILILTGCHRFGNRQNPLYGIIYRDKNEVAQFKNYKDAGGSVINNIKDKSGEYEFGISYLNDSLSNILTFQKFVREPNNRQPKYQILDTINIDRVKENEYITFCDCLKDTTSDPEIIALVIADDNKEYYDRIIKAWRADTKTGRITVIRNTKGIRCINEGYGLEGDGEEDDVPAENDNKADSLLTR